MWVGDIEGWDVGGRHGGAGMWVGNMGAGRHGGLRCE